LRPLGSRPSFQRERNSTHRRRQFDADFAAGQLQDHASLILKLHSASPSGQGAAGADHAVGSLDIGWTLQVQGLPNQLGGRGANRE